MEEEMTITLKDLFKILKKNQRIILYSGLIFAFLLTGYKLSFPVMYTAQGFFKDRENGEAGLENSLTKLLLGPSKQGPAAEAARLMHARKVLDPMIKEMGLQATLSDENSSFFSKFCSHFYVQIKQLQKAPVVILQETPKHLQAKEIHYDGETLKSYDIMFVDDSSYTISHGGKSLAVGHLEAPVSVEGASWTLMTYNPMSMKGKHVILTLAPLQLVAKTLGERIAIEVDSEDPSVLVLKFTDKDRYKASEVVNRLMAYYRDYLIADNEKVMSLQVGYLRKRQNEVFAEQYKLLETHATYLSKDMSEAGFADAKTEVEYFLKRYLEMNKLLDTLAMRETHLQTVLHHGDKEGYPYLLDDESKLISSNLIELLELKQQRDVLTKRLQGKVPTLQVGSKEEMQGMDLDMAERLFLTYHQESTELECEMCQHRFLAEQIDLPAFEMSSLSTTLKDPVSKGIIERSSEIALLLHDDAYRGDKEKERLRNELGVQKRFLREHLLHAATLFGLRQEIIQDKILSLQGVILGLIEQKIDLLEKGVQDSLQGKLEAMTLEKEFLQKHLKKIDDEMGHLPEKWVSDQVLNQSLQLNRVIVEEITRLVEGKNISHHLQIIRSDALEQAEVPLKPDSSRMPFYLALGFFAGCTLAGTGTLAASTIKGVLVSEENLKLSGFHVAGILNSPVHSPLSHQNLVTLRNALAFVDVREAFYANILVVEEKSLSITSHLAKLLVKRGKKVVILNFCEKGHGYGLLQYLEGNREEFTLEKRSGYDEILSGGTSPYIVDYLSSPRFQKLQETLSEKYDVIITQMCASVESEEAITLIPRFDSSVLSLGQIPLCQLKAYLPFREQFVLVLTE